MGTQEVASNLRLHHGMTGLEEFSLEALGSSILWLVYNMWPRMIQ